MINVGKTYESFNTQVLAQRAHISSRRRTLSL